MPYEPHHDKTNILHMRKQRRRSAFAVTAKLISAFVFATCERRIEVLVKIQKKKLGVGEGGVGFGGSGWM